MYFCSHCDYKTHRKDAFNRHENSKKHIRAILCVSDHECENAIQNCENAIQNCENAIQSGENAIQNCENAIQSGENAIHSKYNCNKCNKSYSSKRYLIDHEKTCKGIDSLTCPRCMKKFTSSGNKSKHCKKNNCKPVSIFEADNVKSIINNTTNNNITNTNTNSHNTVNSHNNVTNIYINDYGKERKDYLLDYDNFYDIIRIPNNNVLVKYLKCKNFNPHFPENHCIKYENKRFKLKENNRWGLINANALKDKLFHDCGSEVLNVFDKHQQLIKNEIPNHETYEFVKKKSNYIELELEGSDKEIKNRMLDIVKDDVMI